jgi:hypothetical protein
MNDTMYADVAAMLVIVAVLMEALEVQQPGIKQMLAGTIQDVMKDLPDQDSPHGVKTTLQTFHGFITTDNPMEMLFH